MRSRRTALARLALGQAALLCVVLAAILGAACLAVWQSLLQEARASVDSVATGLVLRSGWRQNDLALEVARRVADGRGQRPAMRFLLVDASGACPVAPVRCPVGNLQGWPDAAPDATGRVRLPDGRGSMHIRVERDDRLGLRLLVGRELDALDSFEAHVVPVLVGMAAAAALAAAGFSLVASKRLLAKVDTMNAFCRTLDEDALDARLAVRGADEFAELSSNINGMLDRIQTLVQVLRQVSSHAAHDLRTPLAALRLELELGLWRTGDAGARDTLGAAVEQVDDVLHLFDRLLEIARNEGGSRAGFSLVDLATATDGVLSMLAALAEDAGVRVVAELQPAWMLGSAPLLQAMVANLVGNAVKFSPAGGTVRVSAGQADGTVRLVVADEGPGIPADKREEVFRHFARLPTTTDRPGHGLGLPLVRAIARRHGFTVGLEDNAPGLRAVVAGPAAVPLGQAREEGGIPAARRGYQGL